MMSAFERSITSNSVDPYGCDTALATHDALQFSGSTYASAKTQEGRRRGPVMLCVLVCAVVLVSAPSQLLPLATMRLPALKGEMQV